MTSDIPNYTLVLQECLDKIKMYGVIGTVEDVRSKDRSAAKVFIRATVAAYLYAEGYSYPKIGKIIHRHPATVMNLLDKLKKLTNDERVLIDKIADKSKGHVLAKELIRHHEDQIKHLKEKFGL